MRPRNVYATSKSLQIPERRLKWKLAGIARGFENFVECRRRIYNCSIAAERRKSSLDVRIKHRLRFLLLGFIWRGFRSFHAFPSDFSEEQEFHPICRHLERSKKSTSFVSKGLRDLKILLRKKYKSVEVEGMLKICFLEIIE